MVLCRPWLRTERAEPLLAMVLLLIRGGRAVVGDELLAARCAGLEASLEDARVVRIGGALGAAAALLAFRARGEDVVSSAVMPLSASITALCRRALWVAAALLTLIRRRCPLPGASAGLSVISSSDPNPPDRLDTIERLELGTGTAAGRDSNSSLSAWGSVSSIGGTGSSSSTSATLGGSEWMP